MHGPKMDVFISPHKVSPPSEAPIDRKAADVDRKVRATIPGTNSTHPSYVQLVRAPGTAAALVKPPAIRPDPMGSNENITQPQHVYGRDGMRPHQTHMPVDDCGSNSEDEP